MRTNLLIIALFFAASLQGQTETLEKRTKSYFDNSYISDGQVYRVMLNPEEEGEFEVTFFSGTMYRVAMSATIPPENVTYSITDSDKNIIFTNEDFDNSPYWNFVFTSTFDCKIVVNIDKEEQQSGIVIMMIGYKNPPEAK